MPCNLILYKLRGMKTMQPPKPFYEIEEAKRPASRFPLLIVSLFLLMAWRGIDWLEGNPGEAPELSKKRREELRRRIADLDDDRAEQYALVARAAGWFPCYSCVGTDSIWLTTFQVWKYGSTRQKTPYDVNGKRSNGGRYADKWLASYKLIYVRQYEGSVKDCQKEELRKIYNYAKLPENYMRRVPLIRPPGNKRDF